MSARFLLPVGLLTLALGSGCGGASGYASAPASKMAERGPSVQGGATTTAGMPAREMYADQDADGVPDASDKKADEAGSAAPAPPPMPSPAPAPPPDALAEAPRKEPAPQTPQQPPRPPASKTDAKAGPDGRDSGAIADKRTPILIYTATFAMAVFEVATSLNEVERVTRESGGFIVKRTDKMATLRVPATKFYEVVGRLEKLGEMIQRDVVAQDVTEEFLDTEIRLRNARAMRDRLAQLLAKANSVQDSLLIERELNRIAAEIDRMEGRLKYLRDRAAFSTITISFEARRTEAPPPSVRLPFNWLRSISLSRLLSL